MIVIAGWIELDPNKRDQGLIDAKPYIDAALEEPGCRAYTWTADVQVPNRIWVYELWDDEDSLAFHFAEAPYKDMGAHLGICGITGSEISKFRVDLEEPVYDPTGTPRADFFTA